MLKATDNGNHHANGENRTGLFRFCGRVKSSTASFISGMTESLPDFNAFSFSSNWRRRLLRLNRTHRCRR